MKHIKCLGQSDKESLFTSLQAENGHTGKLRERKNKNKRSIFILQVIDVTDWMASKSNCIKQGTKLPVTSFEGFNLSWLW